MPLNIDEAEFYRRAFGFAMKAERCAVMSDLSAAVLEAVIPLGITVAASGVVSGPKAASANPFHFANWPAEMITLYLQEEFLQDDPIPRWARNSGRALSWTELFRLLPERDPGRRVIEAGRRFGYSEGLVVPMRCADNSLGLVSLGGPRGAFTAGEQVCLTMIARSVFEAADRIETGGAPGRPSPILSAREIDCLSLLVRGHSDAEMGKLLGLSVRTVRFHFANSKNKFQATSRTHLAALAIAQGYVTL